MSQPEIIGTALYPWTVPFLETASISNSFRGKKGCITFWFQVGADGLQSGIVLGEAWEDFVALLLRAPAGR